MGFDRNDKAARHRMMDLVLEALPELILMPSEQPSSLEIAAHRQGIEASVTINGRKAHEERI